MNKKATTKSTKKRSKTTTQDPIDAAPTREALIADIQRVQTEHPEAVLTRNFYRAHGIFSEGVWQGFFPRFSDFRAAAGMNPDPGHADFEQRSKEKDVADETLVFNDKYVYNSDTDTYVIFLDRAGQRLLLSGEQVKAMKTAYSNWDGQPQTINEVCRTFGIRRDWFIEMKEVLGWTHDSEPFTDEEIQSRPEEDMVKDVLQMKKLSLFRKTEEAKWKETKDNAAKWVDFETNVFIPLCNHIAEHGPKHRAPMLNLGRAKEKYALVIAPFDLHYGKYGWMDETGDGYNRKQARDLLLHHTNLITKQVAAFGRPEKIICASASDYFHVDGPKHATTAGTQQDVDGTRAQILIEGCDLAIEHAEMLAQIAPLQWIGVPGNHDEDSSLSCMINMRSWFRNNKHVTVEVSPKLRKATLYGNSLLSFWHGHGVKPDKMHAVLMKEERTLWRQADRYYAFSGHLHHEVVREINGLKHYQVSSLAGKDRWTVNNGFISDRAMQGYMVSQNRGITAEFISPVIDSSKATGVKMKRTA